MDQNLTIYCVDESGFFTQSITQNQLLPIPNGATLTPPPLAEGVLFPKLVNWEWVLAEKVFVATSAEEALLRLKEARKHKVSTITVTTSLGNTFDGNEEAQTRMARAITAMNDEEMLPWVLADNTVATISKAELKEALRLAGLAMSEIWVQPYLTEQNT